MEPSPIVFLKPPAIAEAVWRPELPLVVLERTESKEQLVVWIAVRWLMAAFPHERGFGSRKIAARAKVNQKYVSRWCEELVGLGLLVPAGEERVRGFAQARPIYTVDLRRLAEQSSAMALEVLLHWGAPLGSAQSVPRDQLSLFSDSKSRIGSDPPEDQTDPPEDQITDPPEDQTDPPGVQITEPLRDQTDPPEDQITEPLRDQSWKEGGRKEGGKDLRARAQSGELSSEQGPRSVPIAPRGAWPLPCHPLDLWADVAAAQRPSDIRHLTALAAEHDGPTGGYGYYWLGRAMLAASLNDDIRSIAKLRAVLTRWRDEQSYGSDRAIERPANEQKEQRHGRDASPAAPRGGRRPRPGERGYLKPEPE